MKTEFNIIIIVTLLASTTLFLIYQNLDETPKVMSFEKYSNKLVQINELSKNYKDNLE